MTATRSAADSPERDDAESNAARHDWPVPISDDDIDFMGHVNNASYLKWVQGAVIEHWLRIATTEAAAAYQWIALKHEITYRRPAFRADKLVMRVRLECVRRESAFYDSVVLRGEEVIAQIKSRWCCIDAASRRPVRVTAELIGYFFPLGQARAQSAPA